MRRKPGAHDDAAFGRRFAFRADIGGKQMISGSCSRRVRRLAWGLKALLDWGGMPLICYQVRQLREAGTDEVIVVLGHRSDEINRRMWRENCR